ncbi:MAG TPA: ribonuclease Y [Bacteroidota bacterium]|nr:ribonuclease Y [Bacteroidota bacterium]
METDVVTIAVLSVILLLGGFALGWILQERKGKRSVAKARAEAREIIARAETAAEAQKKTRLAEAKVEWERRKQEFEKESNARRNKSQSFEKQLSAREENLERKVELIDRKERDLAGLRKEIDERLRLTAEKSEKLAQLIREENQRLERTAGLSSEDARKMLMENLVDEAKGEAVQTLKDIREMAKTEARTEAQKIIVQAIQRTAVDHCVETTVSVLHIENEEMKGRIIGKEGRNIRAFEAATGIDVIVDDTPEAVIISGFDPLRREVARISLERLMADGRIHPARIEEVVEKVRAELDEELLHIGENALIEGGMHGGHRELIRHIGIMKYRSSYGQNLLAHSLEVAHLAGLMAVELGLDPGTAKRGGLLHDIGKTIDRSVEGPHALLGMDLVKKYGEAPVVVNAVGAHHDDIPMESSIAVLVQAADSISGARPGARRENVEAYAKRLQRLETLANSFNGVAKTYAIQAGREIRVIVEHDRVDDTMADQLAHDIAKKIQTEMEYPGQVKVTVIRERRSVAYAK